MLDIVEFARGRATEVRAAENLLAITVEVTESADDVEAIPSPIKAGNTSPFQVAVAADSANGVTANFAAFTLRVDWKINESR